MINDNNSNSIKYTYIDDKGENQTVSIPQSYISAQKRSLSCSHSEACHMYLFDNDLISDETVQELTNKAKSNKVNSAGSGTVKRKPVSRKEDPIKSALIAYFNKSLSNLNEINSTNNITDIEVINKERIIKFKVNNDTYEITLSKKRPPKN